MSRRVLQAMAGAPQGGAEIFFTRLAAALHRAGESQRVLIRRNTARAWVLRAAGIPVGELRFGGRCDLASRLGFRRAVAAFRPDIVMTWMSRATAFCPRGDFVHVARLGGYYDLKYYRGCDHLIGNTRGIVDYARINGWPGERVHYLPNFVPDPREAPPDTAPPAPPRPDRAPLALAMGRLHPNKGHDLLLDALAHVPELHLWIVGDGPLRAALAAQAARLGLLDRVRFLGWVEDAAKLLPHADLLVCPSRHEPLGNVVLEAWAAGVPVVATASFGPAALIEHGRTGLLAPLPGQPGGGAAALGLAIAAVVADPALRARLAAAGRAAYEADYTEAKVVARYRALFDELAG